MDKNKYGHPVSTTGHHSTIFAYPLIVCRYRQQWWTLDNTALQWIFFQQLSKHQNASFWPFSTYLNMAYGIIRFLCPRPNGQWENTAGYVYTNLFHIFQMRIRLYKSSCKIACICRYCCKDGLLGDFADINKMCIIMNYSLAGINLAFVFLT